MKAEGYKFTVRNHHGSFTCAYVFRGIALQERANAVQIVYGYYDDDGYFHDIYGSVMQVKMCGDESVFKAEARVAENGEEPTHYGWLDNEGDIVMIYPEKFKVEMCFPYGPEVAEKAGDGKLVGVIISDIEEVK